MHDKVKIDNCSSFLGEILPSKYVKQYPYVDDKGIWMPIQEYVLDTMACDYRMVMSKEMFVDAYNKWIKGE